jgi:osmoprotectant transport system permease protein
MKRRFLVLLLLPVFSACADRKPLLVGAKEFSENELLAEMFAAVAEKEGIPVRRRIPYGNSFDCLLAIENGTLDLYPEYNGTGLAMMGVPPVTDGEEATRKARELYQPRGLRFVEPLGVADPFVLVMSAEGAAEESIETISDLKRLGAVRFALPPEFLRRPVDGLGRLLSRYGLERSDDVLVSDDKDEIYRTVLNHPETVAVGFATDGHIQEYGLKILDDDLRFFPAYDAMPLVRQDALNRYPPLAEALDELANVIDEQAMRHLVRSVDIDGESPREVALRFLAERNLIEVAAQAAKPRRKLTVSILRGETKDALVLRGLRAVRRTFPGQQVVVKESSSPIEDLQSGSAYLAILPAESFFEFSGERLPQRKTGVEAVAAIGHRVVHLLVRPGRQSSGNPFENIERLGVSPAGASDSDLAQFLLDGYGRSAGVEMVCGEFTDLVERLAADELDGVLTMAKPGAARVSRALRQHEQLALQPLPDWDASRHPFLRLANINRGTYVRMDGSVETLSSQLVLAAAHDDPAVLGDANPATGLRSRHQPLADSLKRDLVLALGEQETIDPILPGRDVTLAASPPEPAPLNPAPQASILSALVLALIGGSIYLLLHRSGSTAGSKNYEP